MAKRKVKSYNKAISDAKKKVHEMCIDFYPTQPQTELLLNAIETLRRPEASTQGVPNPSPKPPGSGTGG